MATFTLNSRNHGIQKFEVVNNGGYVRVNGEQICKDGWFRGTTIMGNAETLEKIARRWWNQYLRNQREF